jgi:polyhydroxybutyrate depolymerase
VLDYSATITVPSTIKPGEKRPFVLYLHGLGASGRVLLGALGIPALAAERRFVYAAPDGSFDSKKQRFWNASKACCNLDKIEVDHVAALRALIQQAAARPEVDPRRIYVVGTSNGAFMAHRLACEVSEIAAIAALSGMGPADGETCTPTGLVAVLQVHGDADDVIPYEGGSALKRPTLPRHPSALDSVTAWAGRDGCGRKPTAAGALDLDEKLEGPESAVLRFPGCKAPVELWTVHGGSHFIGMNHKAQGLVLDFLEKQRKPLSSQPRR